MGLSLPCLTALQACDRQLSAVGITLAGAGIKLLLNLLLIPQPGFALTGAAISAAVSQGTVLLLALVTLIRGTGAGAGCLKVLALPVVPAAGGVLAAELCMDVPALPAGAGFERAGTMISLCIGGLVCVFLLLTVCILKGGEISAVLTKNKK